VSATLRLVRQRLAQESADDVVSHEQRVTFGEGPAHPHGNDDDDDDVGGQDFSAYAQGGSDDDAYYASLPYGGDGDEGGGGDDGGGGEEFNGTRRRGRWDDGGIDASSVDDLRRWPAENDAHDAHRREEDAARRAAAEERRELERRLADVAERTARLRSNANAGNSHDGRGGGGGGGGGKGGGGDDGGGGNSEIDAHLARAAAAMQAAERVRREEDERLRQSAEAGAGGSHRGNPNTRGGGSDSFGSFVGQGLGDVLQKKQPNRRGCTNVECNRPIARKRVLSTLATIK
jgi:hypothetical protein